MIITLTANAAIDKTLTVPNFVTGFRHRASQSLTLPGGKGVNVARVLKTIGQPVVASGLVGGRTGQQIVEGLSREGILNDFVRIAGESRTSTAVIDPTGLSQTEINEWGPAVTEQERLAFLDKIEYLAKGAHYVIICGSLPRKVPDDFYAEILQRISQARCLTILDGSGDPLRHGVRAHPDFVTPNLREAEDLVGHEFHDEQDIIEATDLIRRLGAHNVIIKTPDGCYARLRHGRRQRVYHARHPARSRAWSARSARATRFWPASWPATSRTQTPATACATGWPAGPPTPNSMAPACSTPTKSTPCSLPRRSTRSASWPPPEGRLSGAGRFLEPPRAAVVASLPRCDRPGRHAEHRQVSQASPPSGARAFCLPGRTPTPRWRRAWK